MEYVLVGFLGAAVALIAVGWPLRNRFHELMASRDDWRERAMGAEGRLVLYEGDDVRLTHPSQFQTRALSPEERKRSGK